MPENNKTEEFLQKLAPCIERGDLDACVEEAARVAQEMGIGGKEIFDLSIDMGEEKKYNHSYVLFLVAAHNLYGEDKAVAYCNAGLSAYYIGKLKEADKNYKKSLNINPKFAVANNNYAILLDKLNRKEEAEEHYNEAIKSNPEFAEAHFNLALLLEELNRKSEAKEHYEKAIEINPMDAAEHNNYANLLIELDKKTEAEEHYKKAIDINPKYILAHNNYANLLRQNARYYKAEKEISIALQIEPRNPYALGTYGDILADEDYLDDAIEKYREAIKNSDSVERPEKADIHNNLGWVYANLEQYNRAKKEFEEAHILDPLNIKVIRNIRALRKVKREPKIIKLQWYIAIVLFAGVIATWYLFLTKMLTENIFMVQSIILIAIMIFILFYNQLGRFKAGPFEFEKSIEPRLKEAKSQLSELERC